METQEFPEEDTNSGKGLDATCCSEEEMVHKGKLIWMSYTRIRLYMQMEVLACRDEQHVG